MKKFVVIGGPTRSGTNTVSLFMHLHDDVVSFGSGQGLHPMKDFGSFYPKLLDCPTALQTEQVIQNNDSLRGFLENKNNRIRKNMAHNINKPMIVLRWDYAETIFPLLLGILPKDRELKMVVCLRPIDEVFRSQFHNRHSILDGQENKAREIFNQRVSDSFVQLKHLMAKLPDKIILVDITTQFALREYHKILGFVGLEANSFQKEWMDELPITNNTDWESFNNVQYEGDFRDLEAMRQELLTIGGPK